MRISTKQVKFNIMKRNFLLIILIVFPLILPAQKSGINEKIIKLAGEEVAQYNSIYTDLHKNPELSLMEFNTAKKMAAELKSIGFEVTTGVGGNGVVGIFKNGPGKVIMLRTDMDALPVKENTGLSYSSSVVMKDASGNENNVMHACGHDLHMSTWLGTLRTLVALKNEWKGTILAVGQPGEEGSLGSKAMIKDGLFKKFPKPDFALCYHVSAELPAGTIGYYPGAIFAGVKSAEITVYGSGGHGAMPHLTVDPIVIAARIILDIQTIVSREINPVKPAVVTVGAIHGGTKANVIPDEVKMLLTIRFFENDIYKTIREALINITRGAAITAGLPESKMPLLVFDDSDNPPVVNNPELVITSIKSMKSILGEKNVFQVDPAMVAEDFGKYGLTEDKIPIALFWLGGVNRNNYDKHINDGTSLPPLHNSSFAPDFDPAFITGVEAMTKTVIDLFGNKAANK
jgi:amidohydrolase